MGNVYLRKFSESGHVGSSVDFLTFRIELGICLNRFVGSIRVYFYGFAHVLTSLEYWALV